MKLFDEDGNVVEAFTKEEVNAKTAELTKTAEEAKNALETKTEEFEKLTTRYEDKSNSYTELLKKNKEYEADEQTRKEAIETDYKNAIDEKVKNLAGDDKEYAKELKKHLEREGIKEITNDPAKIESQLKEAKALTNAALEREVNGNPIDGGGGAPEGTNGEKRFTETTEGKNTFDALSDMAGLPKEENK